MSSTLYQLSYSLFRETIEFAASIHANCHTSRRSSSRPTTSRSTPAYEVSPSAGQLGRIQTHLIIEITKSTILPDFGSRQDKKMRNVTQSTIGAIYLVD